jgi:hypothetical protein
MFCALLSFVLKKNGGIHSEVSSLRLFLER